MTQVTYTQYTLSTEAVIDYEALKVDGVELITRTERVALERTLQRMVAGINAEIERSILYGDQPRPVALPKPAK